MLIILSPAKTLDFKREIPDLPVSQIRFNQEANELVNELKKYPADRLTDLMKISDQLAQLNAERFLLWEWPFKPHNTRAAIYAFKGEVFSGLDIDSLPKEDVQYAQKTVRILSGLYGALRPLDAIMPYRLEMGTKLKTSKGKDLYQFWGDKITQQINNDLGDEGSGILVNLASNEYYRSINKTKIEAEIITPVFKDYKNGTYKVISIYAKKARGLMTRFITENKIQDPEELKAFDYEGYHFNNDLSTNREVVFTRN